MDESSNIDNYIFYVNPYREEDRSKSTGDFEINNMEGLAIMNFQ